MVEQIEQGKQTVDAEILTPVQWNEATVPLGFLKPFERNPRTITEAQYEKLKQSLIEDGYRNRISATKDGRILGGHQRLRALGELGFQTVAVLFPDRHLTDQEFKRILIRDNHNNGVWDIDILSCDQDLEELREWGVHDIMNIAPEGKPEGDPKAMVRCPTCQSVFAVKGNRAKADA